MATDFMDAPVVRSAIADGVRLTFHGPIHINTAWLEHELDDVIKLKPKRVEVDFTDSEFVSSMGMGILVGFRKRLKEIDAELVVIAIQKRTFSAFRIARLDQALKIDPAVIINPK